MCQNDVCGLRVGIQLLRELREHQIMGGSCGSEGVISRFDFAGAVVIMAEAC